MAALSNVDGSSSIWSRGSKKIKTDSEEDVCRRPLCNLELKTVPCIGLHSQNSHWGWRNEKESEDSESSLSHGSQNTH